jgi:hypothetical protein
VTSKLSAGAAEHTLSQGVDRPLDSETVADASPISDPTSGSGHPNAERPSLSSSNTSPSSDRSRIRPRGASVKFDKDPPLVVPSQNEHQLVPVDTALQYSWWRAQRVFFLREVVEGGELTPATNFRWSSHLRLRIPEQLMYPFSEDDFDDTHPSPELFEAIRLHVTNQLEESAQRFMDICFTNTGVWRGTFGTIASTVHGIIGFILVLAIGLWNVTPWLFIFTFYCFWSLGFGALVTSNGV